MILILILSLILSPITYTDTEIVNAIYLAEGGTKARRPYGILSVPCDSEAECRRICENTVRNNRRRYAEYGHKQYKTFLKFLASRYAPIGADNDKGNLNQYWLSNVRAILTKSRRSTLP